MCVKNSVFSGPTEIFVKNYYFLWVGSYVDVYIDWNGVDGILDWGKRLNIGTCLSKSNTLFGLPDSEYKR